MKKLQVIYNTLMFAGLLTMFASCNNGLEEINIDPNQSTNNPSIDLLFGSVVPGFIGQVSGSYEVPGQFAQQFAILNSAEGTLTQDDDAISRRTWEIAYSENGGALRSIELMKFEAEKQGNDTYVAVGNILKVYMLSYMTDLFGDIPYVDAGQAFRLEDKYIFPAYDAQADVYKAMIADLEQANTLLANADANQSIDAARDLLFQGDKMGWRKFANSLRLRLLMRQSKATNVSSDVAAIFSNPSQFPVFESNADAALFEFVLADTWPLSASQANIDDVRLSATLVDIMKGAGGVNQLANVEDPRLAWLLNPTANSVTAGTPAYVGQPVGLASDVTLPEDRSLLSDNVKNLNKFWLMTYAELNFLKAEAIAQGMIGGSALEAYEAGVKASLSKYGIDATSTQSAAYLASLAARFSGNELKHIAIQRWMDQPNYGFEGYAVWRRTGFPTLSLGPDVVASQIPTRYFYSSKTTDKNQVNADVAISRAPLNGVNTILQKVWWDVN